MYLKCLVLIFFRIGLSTGSVKVGATHHGGRGRCHVSRPSYHLFTFFHIVFNRKKAIIIYFLYQTSNFSKANWHIDNIDTMPKFINIVLQVLKKIDFFSIKKCETIAFKGTTYLKKTTNIDVCFHSSDPKTSHDDTKKKHISFPTTAQALSLKVVVRIRLIKKDKRSPSGLAPPPPSPNPYSLLRFG